MSEVFLSHEQDQKPVDKTTPSLFGRLIGFMNEVENTYKSVQRGRITHMVGYPSETPESVAMEARMQELAKTIGTSDSLKPGL